MISLECDNLFGTWREQARWLLSHQVDPSQVSWGEVQAADLFATDEPIPAGLGPFQARVPKALLELSPYLVSDCSAAACRSRSIVRLT